MAQQITCDMCGQEVAEIMQTNLLNGDSIAVGATCILPLLLTMAETIVSEMPADVAAQYGEALALVIGKLVTTVTTAEIAAATPAKRGRKPKTAGQPIVTSSGPPDEPDDPARHDLDHAATGGGPNGE